MQLKSLLVRVGHQSVDPHILGSGILLVDSSTLSELSRRRAEPPPGWYGWCHLRRFARQNDWPTDLTKLGLSPDSNYRFAIRNNWFICSECCRPCDVDNGAYIWKTCKTCRPCIETFVFPHKTSLKDWLRAWFSRRTWLARLGIFESDKYPDLATHMRFKLCAISNHLQLPRLFASFEGIFVRSSLAMSPLRAFCAYCGRHANTLDHLIPCAKGGQHVAENLVPACKKCNSTKHTKTGREFVRELRLRNRMPPPTNENIILRREQEYLDLYGDLSESDIRYFKRDLDNALSPPFLRETYRYKPTSEETQSRTRSSARFEGSQLLVGELVIAESLPRPLHNFQINVRSVLSHRVASGPSALNLRVKPAELDAGVGGGELPVHFRLG